MMSPLVPHMAEDVWQNIPYKTSTASVFQQKWPKVENSEFKMESQEIQKWDSVRNMRNDVNKCIEKMRIDKKVGANQECQVFLFTENKEAKEFLTKMQGDDMLLPPQDSATDGMDDLRFILQVSKVTIVDTLQELQQNTDEFVLPEVEKSTRYVLVWGCFCVLLIGLVVGVVRVVYYCC